MAIGPEHNIGTGTTHAEQLEQRIDARILSKMKGGTWQLEPIPNHEYQSDAYSAIIIGHASEADKRFLEARYVNAGWNNVVISNSEECNERGGLVVVYFVP